MSEFRIKKVAQGDIIKYYPQDKIGWFWFDMDRYGFNTYEHAQKALCNYLKETVVEYLDFDPARNCK